MSRNHSPTMYYYNSDEGVLNDYCSFCSLTKTLATTFKCDISQNVHTQQCKTCKQNVCPHKHCNRCCMTMDDMHAHCEICCSTKVSYEPCIPCQLKYGNNLQIATDICYTYPYVKMDSMILKQLEVQYKSINPPEIQQSNPDKPIINKKLKK